MVKALKEIHPTDKKGVTTKVSIEDSPKIGNRIDPHEVMVVANSAVDMYLADMADIQKAALCITVGVPVDYLGNGRWQLRYPCALVEDGEKLKVMVKG